jgi:hypothetical protein
MAVFHLTPTISLIIEHHSTMSVLTVMRLCKYNKYEHDAPSTDHMQLPITQTWWFDECVSWWANGIEA